MSFRQCATRQPNSALSFRQCANQSSSSALSFRQCANQSPSSALSFRQCANHPPSSALSFRQCANSSPNGAYLDPCVNLCIHRFASTHVNLQSPSIGHHICAPLIPLALSCFIGDHRFASTHVNLQRPSIGHCIRALSIPLALSCFIGDRLSMLINWIPSYASLSRTAHRRRPSFPPSSCSVATASVLVYPPDLGCTHPAHIVLRCPGAPPSRVCWITISTTLACRQPHPPTESVRLSRSSL